MLSDQSTMVGGQGRQINGRLRALGDKAIEFFLKVIRQHWLILFVISENYTAVVLTLSELTPFNVRFVYNCHHGLLKNKFHNKCFEVRTEKSKLYNRTHI